ncbi:hypothetical protein P3T76_011945 [Phytophthora citrophthora]|uniref:Uncharacterized protein n=1 Tax=Phytophthora citrophthora TaxID=4793 RepID=A0AAD9G890_9STRA|nr:hypothetical protein P3T76_011945 [Phytophthora citrophthora]
MWSSSPASDADQLFPRRPRRVSNGPNTQPTRRSSATSRLEQRRRDLPPHSVSSDSLWAFDGSSTGSTAFNASSAAANPYSGVPASSLSSGEANAGPPGLQGAVKAFNHGVIGSYSSGEATARMLWNRPEREEEEREEEALPSYLSYLQAPSLTGDAASTMANTVSLAPVTALGQNTDDPMEMKSKELARALQDFIVIQMQGQGQTGASGSPLTSSGTGGGCNCERRVAELEKQVQTLLAAQKEGTPAASEETGNALGDRVSTLEGRQSAFQSQLAQISKVLGVPVGKHGKSSQLKTLVQTLHEEIDTKVQAAVTEVESACIASATKHAEGLIAEAGSSPAGESSTPSDAIDDKKKQDCDTLSASGLPFSTVLNALAEEHEASLTRLSTHFDERLRLEGSQRIALEGRVRARLGELEEWIQQVEGELGGSHFEPSASASPSSIAAVTKQVNDLQTRLVGLEASWKKQTDELSAKLEDMAVLETQVHHQHSAVDSLREDVVSVEALVSETKDETRTMARTAQGLKLIVEKLVRDTGSAEELLQQYVSTITHQVASVTRQYVSVRIRDNNRLLDATLRARVPDYVANESESFLLVRPEAKKGKEGHNVGTEASHDRVGSEANANFSFVLRDDDEDGIRRLLATQRAPKSSTISTTISSDASAVTAAAGATSP